MRPEHERPLTFQYEILAISMKSMHVRYYERSAPDHLQTHYGHFEVLISAIPSIFIILPVEIVHADQ